MSNIIVYTDGGSRGNPGNSALGAVMQFADKTKKTYSQFLGTKTNNEAEYLAAIFALKKIKQLVGKEKSARASVEVRSDSELMVSQLNGEYKLKERNLIPLFVEIWNLKQDFGKVKFVSIPREENREADALLNKELDTPRLFS